MCRQLTFNFVGRIAKFNLDRFQVYYCFLFDKLYKRVYLRKHKKLVGYFKKPSALVHPEFYCCKIFRYYTARRQSLNRWNLRLHNFTMNYAYFNSFY